MKALESVADQCFYTGGAAVFQARGILQGLEVAPVDSQYQFYFNDSILCAVDSTESMRMKAKPSNVAPVVIPSFVNAYPNPAKDQINFVYQYTGNDNATLDVFNILGVEVGEYTVTAAAQRYTLGLSVNRQHKVD